MFCSRGVSKTSKSAGMVEEKSYAITLGVVTSVIDSRDLLKWD